MATPPPPPSQHRYQTRSSPVTPVQAPPSDNEALLRVRAVIHVKETVCGRDSNGKRLPQRIFEGGNWAALKASIFDHCLPHVQFKASCEGDPVVWVVSANKPTLEDFDAFVSIKMGRYFFKPANQEQAHRYIADHQLDTFVISIYKWGNHVSTASDYNALKAQCIQPQEQDRAGAAAESAHQEMVRQLKDRWGSTYSSFDSNWRMWAASILKMPTHQHDVHVASPPPAIMLHLFEPVANGAQVRNQNLQQSMTVALDVVDSCLENLGALKRFVSDVVCRIELDEHSLRAKRRVIEGILHEVTPVAVRTDLVDLLRNIPNLADEEHKEDDE